MTTTHFHDTEQACAWLREVPWGGALIRQLHADPRPCRAAKWLGQVNGIRDLMAAGGDPGAALVPDEEVDVAGWPAMAAGLLD